MKQHAYRSAEDLYELMVFNGQCIQTTGGCGYLHPGDIPHHLFSGNKLFDPAEVMTIWEDEAGVAGWFLAGPRHRSYDAQVRPDLRGTAFEVDLLMEAEACTLVLMKKYGYACDRIFADAYEGDQARMDLLEKLGWAEDGEKAWAINWQTLTDLADPQLPPGYRVRTVGSLDEAAQLAEVHAAAFGTNWTSSMYRKLMQTPGYRMDREYVILTPEGRYAGFTVTWHDEINKRGLFEPVGIHKDFQGRGLGKALMRYVLLDMAKQGLVSASVMNSSKNKASLGLYRSVGFKPKFYITDYVKVLETNAKEG